MRILQILGALLLLVASPALAKEGSAAWIVTQKSGEVRVLRNGLQPASVQVRAALSPGDTIATGANGRAMLTRGGDYVIVAPGSRLMLPKEQQATGFTRLVQQVGTMLYKVRHTGVPHFAVDTPMLAAVVKGTSFTVVVDKDRAAVQVTEGLVEVSSAAGDAKRLVEGGVTVYVGRDRPHEIIEVKAGAADLPGSGGNGEAVKIESSGDVPLSSVTDLTGGLVREAPVAPVVTVASTPTPAVAAVTPATSPSVPAATPVAPIDPVAPAVDPTVPSVTAPVVDVVDTTVPTVTAPVIDIVEVVTEPVIDIVEATVPTVTAPVVDVVEVITDPVVDIVETTVPTITEPVVDVVEATVPTVTEPIVDIVETVTIPLLGRP